MMIRRKWGAVLFIFLLMLVAYGSQLPKLGFYLDDWASTAAFEQGGEAGMIQYGVNDSRPFEARVMAKCFTLFGIGCLRWQVITLSCRFLAALCGWALLRRLWPEEELSALAVSALFAVFPFFRHQAICLAYFIILLQYFIILLSFLLTVMALQIKDRRLAAIFYILGCLTSLFHLACTEYYLSLEALRLLLIWLVLSRREGEGLLRRSTILKTILLYLPYGLIILAILGYRFLYVPTLSADVRPIELSETYHGLNLIMHLLGLGLQYLSESLFGVWYRSLNLNEFGTGAARCRIAPLIGLFVGALSAFTLARAPKSAESKRCLYEMFIIGACAMLLGFLPGMAINVSPSSGNTYHDRFLIPAFWGISLFTVCAIRLIFVGERTRAVWYGILIAISICFHIANAHMYIYSRETQREFQWNLKWRVPDLAADTAVISDGATASFMGGWADGAMLFELYGKRQGLTPTPYWYFSAPDEPLLNTLAEGIPITKNEKMFSFSTDAENILILTKTEYGKCVWVLDEADSANPYLEGGIGDYIPYQNKSRILGNSAASLPKAIFGEEPVHSWCRIFETADRLLDEGDIRGVSALWDEAVNENLKPGNATELRPFIRAAALNGDWEQAEALTRQGIAMDSERVMPYFENLWSLLTRDIPEAEDSAAALFSEVE